MGIPALILYNIRVQELVGFGNEVSRFFCIKHYNSVLYALNSDHSDEELLSAAIKS